MVGEPCPSLPTSPSRLPLRKRYEALERDSQKSDGDKSPSRLEGVPKARQPTPSITPSSVKKEGRVIVMGDSLLKGKEGPICCLPGARIRDIAGKSLAWYSPPTTTRYCFFWLVMTK